MLRTTIKKAPASQLKLQASELSLLLRSLFLWVVRFSLRRQLRRAIARRGTQLRGHERPEARTLLVHLSDANRASGDWRKHRREDVPIACTCPTPQRDHLHGQKRGEKQEGEGE